MALGSLTTLGAIVVVFDASLAGVGGDTEASQGLWMGQIPEQFTDQDLPFVRFIHDGDAPFYNTELGYYEVCHFKFEVYGIGLAATEATAAKIKTAFDKPDTPSASETFLVQNARVMQCWRPDGAISYQVAEVGERVSTGEKVFCATLTYEMSVCKTL